MKGGAGTTTIALNMALTLHDIHPQHRIVLVELREGVGSLAIQAGSVHPQKHLSILLEQGAAAVNRNAVSGLILKYREQLHLLPASIRPEGLSGTPLTMDFVRRLLHILTRDYDDVILDMKPALGKATVEVLRQIDQLLIVLEPHHIALEQGRAMLRALSELNIGQYNMGIVVNERTPAPSAMNRTAIEMSVGHPILGVLPAEPHMTEHGLDAEQPLALRYPDSLFVRQLRLIVSTIVTV